MKLFSKHVGPALQSVASNVRLPSGMPEFKHDFFLVCEQLVAALVLATFFGMIERFVPWYLGLAGLALATACSVRLFEFFKTGVCTFLAVSAAYYFGGQPTLSILLALAGGIAAGGAAALYIPAHWGWRVAGGIVAWLAATAGLLELYYLTLTTVLPVVHPFFVQIYNVSPLIAVVLNIAVVGYCTIRQPHDERSWYWAVTPVFGTLFVAYFWPSHSYLAMAVSCLVAAGLSIYAFLERPTEEDPWRSYNAFYATAAAGVAFGLLFWVGNSWTWFYHYQMANAVEVTTADQLPPTINNRLVPHVSARDACSTKNLETYTKIAGPANPLVIADAKTGQERFYWQCSLEATSWKGHPYYFTGGTVGVILADAGERGKFGDDPGAFIFGENSAFTAGVFALRHPGSEMLPRIVVRSRSGEYRIAVPYRSRVMQWGGMIPEVSGVMTISHWGFVEDYTPAQAAREFPGATFMPDDMAREYAELWAQDSSWIAKEFSGNVLEVSENDKEANKYPRWQDFVGVGLKGVIPFEPVGNDAAAFAAAGLFDRASLSMILVKTGDLGVKGPKWIAANPAQGHSNRGLNLVTKEELLVVSRNHHLYWLTSDMQPNVSVDSGFAGNTLYDAKEPLQHNWDITEPEQIDHAIEQFEQPADKPAQQ